MSRSFRMHYFDNAKRDVVNILNILAKPGWSNEELIILKSSVYLVTYNLVEGSVQDLIKRIFDTYNNDKPILKTLTKERKSFICEYNNPSLTRGEGKINQKDNFFKILFGCEIKDHNQEDFLNSHVMIVSKKNDEIKKEFGINGNIDEKSLRIIALRLGFGFRIDLKKLYIEKHMLGLSDFEKSGFNLQFRNPLEEITKVRNELAHGGDFFSSSSSNLALLTSDEIQELVNSTCLYVEQFKISIEKFIQEKGRIEKSCFISKIFSGK